MATMKIMSPIGHETITFDPANKEEVEEVREKFDDLIAEGYFGADVSTKPGINVTDFPEEATDILLFPAMAGGSR